MVEPFEFTVTSANITSKSKIETNIELSKKDFVVMSDSSIDIKLDLNFKLNIIKECNINLIESIDEKEARIIDGGDMDKMAGRSDLSVLLGVKLPKIIIDE